MIVSRRINWTAFAHAIAGVNAGWLGTAAALTAGSAACSGWRWRQVIAPEAALSAREAHDVVMIGNLANLVAPSRAGDLARAALVSRRRTVPVSRVLGAILVERYADVVALVVLAVALSLLMRVPDAIQVGVAAFAAAGVAAILAVATAADRLPGIAGRVVSIFAPSWAQRTTAFLAGLFGGIRNAGQMRRFPVTLVLTLGVWALAGAGMWCTVRAFALPVPWYAALFVLLVINLGGVIPASPGSIGVYHYLAITALAVWLADVNVALGFAVVAHAMGLAVVTLLGVSSLVSQHESLFRVERAAQHILEDMQRPGDHAVR